MINALKKVYHSQFCENWVHFCSKNLKSNDKSQFLKNLKSVILFVQSPREYKTLPSLESYYLVTLLWKLLPCGSDSKECLQCGRPGFDPWVRKILWKREWLPMNGYPFQYSCLGNPTDRGAWEVTVHGITKSWTRLRK